MRRRTPVLVAKTAGMAKEITRVGAGAALPGAIVLFLFFSSPSGRRQRWQSDGRNRRHSKLMASPDQMGGK